MAERMVDGNDVEIWAEDFGDPSDPTILLVMGASGQAILWPDELIDALVAGGKHVIRYDNRDVGQTTCFDFATDPYTIADMAADAVAVLDAYNVDQADIVGASMGGMIVQTVALDAPDRVRTMTSIMSTPLARGFLAAIMGGGDTDLPGPEQKVLDFMAVDAERPSSDEERVDRAVEQWRALAGTMAPFDEEQVREREGRILARAKDIDAAMNHQLADRVVTGSDRRSRADHCAHAGDPRHGRPDSAVRTRGGDGQGHPGGQDAGHRGHGPRAAGACDPDSRRRDPRPHHLNRRRRRPMAAPSPPWCAVVAPPTAASAPQRCRRPRVTEPAVGDRSAPASTS